MRKVVILATMFALLLISNSAFASRPQNFSDTVWDGWIDCQAPGPNGALTTIQIVLTFGTVFDPYCITGTIGAIGSSLPTGFPTEFSATIGPIDMNYVHMAATDVTGTDNAVVFADALKPAKRQHSLAIRGNIIGGPMAGTSFVGFLYLQ